MWLLDTKEYKLRFFAEEKDADFAILSHRWTEDEVLFQDLQSGEDPSRRKAWPKVLKACRQARRDSHSYIWIDAVCINRTSSTELSEAINSMYRWYSTAAVCYVYLHDVDGQLGQEFRAWKNLPREKRPFSEAWIRANSGEYEWFQRGWTLQELIAPKHLVFFDNSWQRIGTRYSLSEWTSLVSRVPESLLIGQKSLDSFTVAQRMSWAADRKTTRAEDIAYCLIGLFDVNMALLYGEGGERAFIRLQEEIIRNSEDHSLFAWKLSEPLSYSGLLARSPSNFAGCGEMEETPVRGKTSFQPSNIGLQINLDVCHYGLNVYLASLDCMDSIEGRWAQVGIFIAINPENERYARRIYKGKDRAPFRALDESFVNFKKTFAVKNYPQPFFDSHLPLKEPLFGFFLDDCKILTSNNELLTLSKQSIRVVARPGTWNPDEMKLRLKPKMSGAAGTALGLAIIRDVGEPWLFAKVGFDEDFQPWAWIANSDDIANISVTQEAPPRSIAHRLVPVAITGGTFVDTMISPHPHPLWISSFDSLSTRSILREGVAREGRLTIGDIRTGLWQPDVQISRSPIPGESEELAWTVRILVKMQR